MRTEPAGQTSGIAALHRATHVRVFLEDPNGDMQNMSTLGGVDWFDGIDNVSANEDEPISSCTLRFKRAVDTLSLAPLMQGSTINRDSEDAYAPFVNPARRVEIQIATMEGGDTPATEDWAILWRGRIDNPDWGGTKQISFNARDYGAVLLDTFIEAPTTTGSDDTTVPIEDAMQALLDEVMGEDAPTLFVIGDPDFDLIKKKDQEPMSLMQALQAMADQLGWSLRYLWNDSEEDFVLTLYEPDRTNTTAVHTFGPDDYYAVTQMTLDQTSVRNAGKVLYSDEDGVDQEYVAPDRMESIEEFGRRFMQLDMRNTAITNEAMAERFLESILDDLEAPSVVQQIEAAIDWRVQLGDVLEFTANGKHYDTNQTWAVFGYSHQLSGNKKRTILDVRGKPSGGYLRWLHKAGLAGDTFTTPGRIDRSLFVDFKASPSGVGTATITAGRDVVAARVMATKGARPTKQAIAAIAEVVPLAHPQTVIEGLGQGQEGETLWCGVLGYRNADGSGEAIGPVYASAPIQAKPNRTAPEFEVRGFISGLFNLRVELKSDPDHAMQVGEASPDTYIRFTRLDTGASVTVSAATYASTPRPYWSTTYTTPAAPGFDVKIEAIWKVNDEELETLLVHPGFHVEDDGVARIGPGEALWEVTGKITYQWIMGSTHASYLKYISRRSGPYSLNSATLAVVEVDGITVTTAVSNYLRDISADDIPSEGTAIYWAAVPYNEDDEAGPLVVGQKLRAVGDAGVPELETRTERDFTPVILTRWPPGRYRSFSFKTSLLAEIEEDDTTDRLIVREVPWSDRSDFLIAGYEVVDADGVIWNMVEWAQDNGLDAVSPDMLEIPIGVGGGREDARGYVFLDSVFSNVSNNNVPLRWLQLIIQLRETALTGTTDRLFFRVWGHEDALAETYHLHSIPGVIEGPNYLGANVQDPIWANPYTYRIESTDGDIDISPPSLWQYTMPRLEALGLKAGMYVEPRAVLSLPGDASSDGALNVVLRTTWGPTLGDAARTFEGPAFTWEAGDGGGQYVIRGKAHVIPSDAPWVIVQIVGTQDFTTDFLIRFMDFRFLLREEPEEDPPKTPNRTAYEEALFSGAAHGSLEQGQQSYDQGETRTSTGEPVNTGSLYAPNAGTQLVTNVGSPLMLSERMATEASSDITAALAIATQALDQAGGAGGGGGPELDDFFVSIPQTVAAYVKAWKFAFRPSVSGTLTDLDIQLNPAGEFTGTIKLALYTAHATEPKPGARVQITSGLSYSGLSLDGWSGLSWALTGGTLYWLVCALDGDPLFDTADYSPLVARSMGGPSALAYYPTYPGVTTVGELDNPWDGPGITATTYQRPICDGVIT